MKKSITILVAILVSQLPGKCLQATINIPNNNVLDKNTAMIKEVSGFSSNNQKVTLSPNITYGVGGNTEVSVGAPVIMDTRLSRYTVKGAIEAKTVIPTKNRITIAGSIYPPFTKGKTEAYIVSHITKEIQRTNTKISIGGYMQGDERLLNTGGVAIIVKQKVYKDLSVISEYTTGKKGVYAIGLNKTIKGVGVSGSVIVPKKGIGFQITLCKKIGVVE